MNHKKIKQD